MSCSCQHQGRNDAVNEQSEGQWNDDKQNGQGKMHYANGQVKEGMWSNDKFID
jgi:antitoxin component YwqK of YwqJK toxin-antitoxin module